MLWRFSWNVALISEFPGESAFFSSVGRLTLCSSEGQDTFVIFYSSHVVLRQYMVCGRSQDFDQDYCWPWLACSQSYHHIINILIIYVAVWMNAF